MYILVRFIYMFVCMFSMIDLKCSNCSSKQIYTTSKERVCRRCGNRSKLDNSPDGLGVS